MTFFDNYKDFLFSRAWYSDLILLLGFVLVFNFLARKLVKLCEEHFEKHGKTWLSKFFKALYAPLSIYVWLFALIYVFFAIKKYFQLEIFNERAESSLLMVTGIGCVGWFFLRWKKYMIEDFSAKSKAGVVSLDLYRINSLDKLLSIVISFITLISILDVTGEGFTTLLTIGGIGAAAIGFASKEFIANFFGGFTIYLNTPFFIGDVIEVSGKAKGTVEEIGWYLTRIRDSNKQAIFIPNSQFAQVVVTNLSNITHRFIDIAFDLRYQDAEKAPKIIQDVKEFLKNHTEIDQNQNILVSLVAFGENSLKIKVSAYTKTIDFKKFNAIREDLFLRIYQMITYNAVTMKDN